ncbi:hypothetical protein PInf_010988 [Phytophthora infestans]|nr:hypothetical protein PInf_010988 [Phytophthora infestans]
MSGKARIHFIPHFASQATGQTKETLKPSMNWMTSGKHRALYSQRGRRRQMHFPSQVQRQRVTPTSPSRSSQSRAGDSTRPWYIVSIGDDDESQDIRVLELERKGAMCTAGIQAEGAAGEPAYGSDSKYIELRSISSQKRGREQEVNAQEERSANRCIFTPVKKARKYESSRAAHSIKSARGERPPSSIASGVDLLFFNDGQELPHKSRTQHAKQDIAESVHPDTRLSQRICDDGGEDELQIFHDEDLHSHNGKFEAQQHSPDSDNTGVLGHEASTTSRSEFDQRDYQLWRINSRSCAGSSPDTTFSRPDTASFGNANEPTLEASPLSFKMSRAKVLQSQLSTRIRSATREHRMNFTPSRRPSPAPSPSTSTSSQDSIVLGRPPLGWQKKLLLALEENPRANPEPASFRVGSSPRKLADSDLENDQLDSPPSISNSRASDSSSSITDALIPVDAKERIMAAATSQHSEGPSSWYPRPTMTKPGNATNTDTIFSGKRAAFQQSWVMSSRTKTILDAAAKAPSVENAIQKSNTKHLEMESVAIYMYTLVQCYKIDEKLRFVHCSLLL